MRGAFHILSIEKSRNVFVLQFTKRIINSFKKIRFDLNQKTKIMYDKKCNLIC
jgi:hypothetical protein